MQGLSQDLKTASQFVAACNRPARLPAMVHASAGSILDISKYRDTCRSSIPISSIEAALVDTRYSILDTRYSILDTRYSISILDPRSSILDTRYSILDTRYSDLDPRYSILDTRYLRTSKIDDDTRYSDRYSILNSAITEDLPDPIMERFGGLPCTAL